MPCSTSPHLPSSGSSVAGRQGIPEVGCPAEGAGGIVGSWAGLGLGVGTEGTGDNFGVEGHPVHPAAGIEVVGLPAFI